MWALMGMGVRCVVAEGFGDIFYGNCFQNGLLPVRLPPDAVRRLADQCTGSAQVTVDLHRQAVTFPDGEQAVFAIEPLRRTAMLEGLDEVGLTLRHAAAIAGFQAQDRVMRPWVWQVGGTTPGT